MKNGGQKEEDTGFGVSFWLLPCSVGLVQPCSELEQGQNTLRWALASGEEEVS